MAQLSDAWSLALTNLQTAKHGCRYRALRMLSSEAAARKVIAPGSIDVLFIDGLHTYQGVRQVRSRMLHVRALARSRAPTTPIHYHQDIADFTPLLRASGGVVLFNDYKHKLYPGVTRAVHEYVAQTRPYSLVRGEKGRPPGRTNAAVVTTANATETWMQCAWKWQRWIEVVPQRGEGAPPTEDECMKTNQGWVK